MDQIVISSGFPIQTLKRQSVVHRAYVKTLLLPLTDNSRIEEVQLNGNVYEKLIVKDTNTFVIDDTSAREKKTISLTDAQEFMLKMWPILCDPTGETILTCIQDTIWAIFMARAILQNIPIAQKLTTAYKTLLTVLGLTKLESYDTFKQMVTYCNDKRTTGFKAMIKIRKMGNLSTWKTKDAVTSALREFQDEAQIYCTRTRESNFKTVKTFFVNTKKIVDYLNRLTYNHRDERPWPIFFGGSVNTWEPPRANVRDLTITSVFRTIQASSYAKNKSQLKVMLENRDVQRAWKDLSRALFVCDPFENPEIISNNGPKIIKAMLQHNRGNPIDSPEFVSRGLELIKETKSVLTPIAETLNRLCDICAREQKQLPGLEIGKIEIVENFSNPTREDVQIASEALQKHRLVDISQEEEEEGSLLYGGILLVALGIYLYTR